MKINIRKYEEMRGIIKKKPHYILETTIEFGPDEVAIIKKVGYDDFVLMEVDGQFDSVLDGPAKVRRWMDGKPTTFVFLLPSKIAEYEEVFRESVKLLSGAIKQAQQGVDGDESFEL